MRFLYSIWRLSQVFMHHFAAKPVARRVFNASDWPLSYETKKRAGSVLIPVYAPHITMRLPCSIKGCPMAQIASLPVDKTRLQKGK